MDEERRRILRMMAEGTISVEECDELLRSLSNRRKEKTQKDVQDVQGERPIWPYVMLVILGILVLPVSFIGFRMIPCISGPAVIVLFIFWVWMIVDCLSRLPCDFRLLFTSQHQHEKWIWLAIVILAAPVGAIVYFFIIRQPTQQIAPPSTAEKPPVPPKPAAVSESPLRPARRARSIKPLAIMSIIFAILVIPALLPFLGIWPIYHHGPLWRGMTFFRFATMAIIALPAIIVSIWVIFWICMLISCLSRDYREFGTLITSDKSADKLVWVLLILFLPIIGAIAYHISIRRQPVSAA